MHLAEDKTKKFRLILSIFTFICLLLAFTYVVSSESASAIGLNAEATDSLDISVSSSVSGTRVTFIATLPDGSPVSDVGIYIDGSIYSGRTGSDGKLLVTSTEGTHQWKAYYPVTVGGYVDEGNYSIDTTRYGFIEISSSPSEANIYLDGQLKGTTPTKLTNVSVGSHNVKLTKDGYEDYTVTVTVLKDQASTVSATLTIKNSYDVVWDTGLKVNPNGYRFYNFNQQVITWDLFKKSFNGQEVENKDGSRKQIASKYYDNNIWDLSQKGSCFGMASSSLILSESGLNAWELYDPEKKQEYVLPQNPIFMNLPILSDYIEYYHIRQYSAPCIIEVAETRGDFDDIYDYLESTSMNSFLKDPLLFSFYWNDATFGNSGHTVVPLRFEEDSNHDLGLLYCYDSNSLEEVTFLFNRIDKTVRCEHYNQNNSVTPVFGHLSSVKKDGKIPDTLDKIKKLIAPIDIPEILYLDSSGNKLGYLNGAFYDEIPGACRVVPLGNSTNNFSETYYLGNVSVTRKIVSTGEGNVSFSTFKPDTFIGLDFYTKKDEVNDLLISPSGSSVEFTSSEGTPYLNMTIIKGTEEYEHLVNLDDLSVEPDSEFNLSISENLEEICITNNGSSKDYHLTIEQIGSNPGVYSFVIPVNVEENTSTFITPVDWNSLNDTKIRLEYDVGCDGKIDGIEIIDSATINMPTGTVTITAHNGTLDNVSRVNESQIPSIPDADFTFGVFKFNVSDVSTGGNVNISITWPEELFEAGCRIYGRSSDNTADHWYEIPSTVSKDNMTITVQLTDGGQGDNDLTANGEIICNKGFAIVAYANVDDWNPWNDPDSAGGESINLSELQEAIYDWRFGITLSNGEKIDLTRLQGLIYSWRFG